MSIADLDLGGDTGTASTPQENVLTPVSADGHAKATVQGQNGARPEDGHSPTAPAEDGHTKPKPQSPKSQRLTLDTLLKIVQSYNHEVDLNAIRKAYAFAEEAHEGQMRASGEPYIAHPLQVAIILAEMRLDPETLQAALLHDTIEDTAVTYDDIQKTFGQTVAHLVEGVTELGSIPKLRQQSSDEKRQRELQHQAENLRKMFLAMFD